jgi:hypothetical protein
MMVQDLNGQVMATRMTMNGLFEGQESKMSTKIEAS